MTAAVELPDQAHQRVEEAVARVRAGGMVILVDDEDRENEGDLVMAAEHATPESINFMATHARGLICLSLTERRVQDLGLGMMVDTHRSGRSTAFTVSIEARQGVSTGISAADRAHTIRTAVDTMTQPTDLVSPGHIFPLRARPGGVLQRSGHTEGSVDLASFAGCQPAGVICEIMKEDGTMARLPDLQDFARRHGLLVLSIADLITYRLERERLVKRTQTSDIRLRSGNTWKVTVYESATTPGRPYIAWSLGNSSADLPTLVRVHTAQPLLDAFGVARPGGTALQNAIDCIETEGRGVVLYLPSDQPVHSALEHAPFSAEPSPLPRATDRTDVLREFGLGAQVLADLGLGRIRLITERPRKIVGVKRHGLTIDEYVSCMD